jgi:hypothetical protein
LNVVHGEFLSPGSLANYAFGSCNYSTPEFSQCRALLLSLIRPHCNYLGRTSGRDVDGGMTFLRGSSQSDTARLQHFLESTIAPLREKSAKFIAAGK